MNNRKSIQYLDELLLEYFSILDDYIDSISKLSTALKHGHFSIAKANYLDLYIYGRFKTLHGYNGHMKALYYVYIILLLRDDIAIVTEDATQGTRVATATEEANDMEKISDNPLNWFGILVPHELRSAQQHFRKGLEESVRMVQLRLTLDELEKKIILYRKEVLHLTNT
ncbi:hypothetical protein PCANB_002214 [Pneumocystis canis]|nr:hypothetical protein PCK1_002380 [Pneumocystis canis]KAG5438884.1 hypothetical protein PCANB_002214 [Pneumocystis canis]